jgi:hypothetical protein
MIPVIGGPYELARHGLSADSPAFTGTPTAPTAAIGTDTDQIASTAFAARLSGVLGVTLTDGNQTLTKAQTGMRVIQLFGTMTNVRQITFPAGQQKSWVVRNATQGGQDVILQVSGGGQKLRVPPDCTVEMWSNGTDLFSAPDTLLTPGWRVGGTNVNALVAVVGQSLGTVSSLAVGGTGGLQINGNGKLSFNTAVPIAKPAISGSRGANAALASLLTQLAALGLITDSTTA